MSQKITKFTEIISNPLTTHNFVVQIPGWEEDGGKVETIVSATTFPTERMRSVILYYMGERIKYPTIPENSGEWSCTIPDSEAAITFKKTIQEKGLLWNQVGGVLLPGIKKTIRIAIRTVNDQEVVAVKLHGAYIVGRGDVNLSNTDPTAALMWNVAFSFDWVEDEEVI